MKKRIRQALILILLAAVAAFVAPQAYWYAEAQGPVPPGVRLAGLDLGASDAATIDASLQYAFSQPVAVYYDQKRLILQPREIGLRVKTADMLAAADAQTRGLGRWRGFVYHLMGRVTPPITVTLQYAVDSGALATWLDDVAAQYDRPPEPAHALPLVSGKIPTDTLPFVAGKPGLSLAAQESVAGIMAALSSADKRETHLVLVETPAPPPGIGALQELLSARAEHWPGIATVFVRDIGRGQEVNVNSDVAFAGMSTMKLAILVEVFRHLDRPPNIEETKLLTQTLGLSGNFSANLLLRVVGDGSAQAGVEVLTASMRKLGLVNTFMATPYDVEAQSFRITTPANSRTDLTTNPDIHMQTTARDMGLLAEMIVQCSEGGGTLLAAYAPDITQAECQKMIEIIALNKLEALIPGGLPSGTRVVHKHGYINDSHADVAIVWGPSGPYVLSIFIFMPRWVLWEFSDGFMGEVSRATWDYFTWAAGAQP
ncbi:MAG: serine hydrolase [Anaerolineae bacterium]